jgi:uncharacterized protein (DUF1501 family)
MTSRRHFLATGGTTVLSFASAGVLGTSALAPLLLAPRTAWAADYKALVCVFLFGGNDGNNSIVPTDSARYSAYAAARPPLALPQASLLGLSGTEFGLHPSLSGLQNVWSQGKLAVLFNTGPLAKPLTKAEWAGLPDNSPLIPQNLFSHSDQQVLWECGGVSAVAREGWGGRASEVLGTINPVIALASNARFGVSAQRMPLVLPDPGEFFGAYGTEPADLQWQPVAARKQALDAMLAQDSGHQLGNAYQTQLRDALLVSQRLAPIVQATPGGKPEYAAIDAAFAPITSNGEIRTHIGKQLYQTAKLIVSNATVQGNRQIFIAEQGGFDTHAQQISNGDPLQGTHAGLLRSVGDALACFHKAMTDVGLANAVTAFTQSDFGRTLVSNDSTGSDHAWGNHHFIIGGAVQGGLYGSYPDPVPGGDDDAGVESWERQGRWIPKVSVEQYAATLLAWFGATPDQLNAALPNLSSFSGRPAFMG